LSFSLKRLGKMTGIAIVLLDPAGQAAGQATGQAAGQATGQAAGQATGQADVYLDILDKEKEEDKNLSSILESQKNMVLKELVEDTFLSRWPYLSRHGFTALEAMRSLEAYTQNHLDCSRFLEGIDHAEWELENRGVLIDATGNTVLSIAGYVYRALSKTGYYRKPSGYVSLEERRAQESMRVAQEKKVEQDEIAFSLWWDALSEAERERIDAYTLGPKNRWRKEQWRRATTQKTGPSGFSVGN
jgi:hypothetical protein